MSTGNINLDILLQQMREDALADSCDAIIEIQKRYPTLNEKEAMEIHSLVDAALREKTNNAALVVTAPPSFGITSKVTKMVVREMIEGAQNKILITGYSISGYFSELIDCIIKKSQSGVFVKFFVNNVNEQKEFDKLFRYKSDFLKIYNYPKRKDSMSALHAKVISVDNIQTLVTSANLSYHGQEGNIELGTQISSKEIAQQVDDIFTKLIFQKVFVEV